MPKSVSDKSKVVMKTFVTILLLSALSLLIPVKGISGTLNSISTLNEDDSARIFKLLTDARMYASQRDYEKAVESALKAASISENDNFEYGKYRAYKSLEQLYKEAGKPLISAKYKLKAMNSQSRLEAINYERDERERIEKSEKERYIREQQRLLEIEQQELKLKMDEIARLEKDKKVSKSELDKRKYEIAKKQIEIDNKKQTIDIQRETINSTFNQLSLTLDELETQRLHAKIVEDSLQMVKKNEEVIKISTKNQNLINYLYIVGVSGLIILAASFYRMYTVKTGIQDLLVKKNNEIEQEKKKSDDLLLSMLPVEVADELKKTGKYEPRHFEKSAIMVVNFRNFIKIGESGTPKDFIEKLDKIYGTFDQIVKHNDIEKINSVGDTYVSVSGVPDVSAYNPMNIARAAREMQQFISTLNLENKNKNLPVFDIVIGIHSGPLTAGIIGNQKFAFDIWGETANMTFAMEKNCDPGKINISQNVFNEIKDKVRCENRGKINGTDSGDMDMFYLDEIIED